MRQTLLQVLWNPSQKRPRVLWRVLGFLVLFAVFANPLVLALDATDNRLAEASLENVAVAVGAVAALWVAARFLDRRTFADYGLRLRPPAGGDFVAGAMIGGASVAAAVAVGVIAGWLELDTTPVATLAGVPVGVAIAGQAVRFLGGSFFEETVSRGYLLRTGAEALRSPLGPAMSVAAAWLGTAMFFGAAHLANPRVTGFATLNLTALGLVFGLGMVFGGSLALPIGLHFSWNLLQNSVFGLANSGKPPVASLFRLDPVGPDVITGGAFGIEGGLLGSIAIILAAALSLAYLKRRGPLQVTEDLSSLEGSVPRRRGGERLSE